MATHTILPDAEPVNGCRARCPRCFHRFPWPHGEPWTVLEPLVLSDAACPQCRLVVPLVEEPLDERWHEWTETVIPKETVYR